MKTFIWGKTVTIVDIAKESGYSVTTVSRVLNNRQDVSPEAKNKIMEIVKAHNCAKYKRQEAEADKLKKYICACQRYIKYALCEYNRGNPVCC